MFEYPIHVLPSQGLPNISATFTKWPVPEVSKLGSDAADCEMCKKWTASMPLKK